MTIGNSLHLHFHCGSKCFVRIEENVEDFVHKDLKLKWKWKLACTLGGFADSKRFDPLFLPFD